MTSLDDALEASSVVFVEPDLIARWEELPPNFDQTNDPAPIHNLTTQMQGDFHVVHSYDDGFPDAVTMTNGNDASGTLEAGLVGRQALIADVMGWRSNVQTGSGVSALIIPFTQPTDAEDGDQLFFIISWATGAAWGYPDPVAGEPDWQIVSTVIDSGGIRTDVYTRKHWVGGTGYQVTLFPQFVNTSYTWICVAAYARTANNMRVPFRIGTDVGQPEASSVTAHVAPDATLPSRGYLLSVWSTVPAGGTWSPATGVTELTEVGGTGSAPRMMVGVSPVRDAGVYSTTVSTTSATAIATMQVIPVVIGDLADQGPDSYFSPFNKLSPVYGFARDTAGVDHTINVVTEDGVQGTQVFKGMMEDIGVVGKQVVLKAVSQTRIDMDRSLVLPMVFGRRENCTVDWLVTWLMARGGQFVGPSPSPYARYWNPLYGSLHGHLDGPKGFNVGFYYNITNAGSGLQWPQTVEGPFLTGMYACQNATEVREISLSAYSLYEQTEILPFLGTPEEVPIYDQFSHASSQGRFTFWLRGDPVTAAPSYLAANKDYIMLHNLYIIDSTGKFLGYVVVKVLSATRKLTVMMGSTDGGSGTYTFDTTLTPLETDGQWHFYGVSWDYSAGEAKAKKDGNEEWSNFWDVGGWNYTFDLPDTDAIGRTMGHVIHNLITCHVPMSDVQIESGFQSHYLDPWTRHYPNPVGQNATMRATHQQIRAGITESVPVNAWSTIAQLAQAVTAAYRINEQDNFEFLPPSYFGETAQMTPTFVADTELNASELGVVNDATKSRNVVTVKFPETEVDLSPTPVLQVTSPVEIPRGINRLTFALETDIAEVHGAGPGSIVGITVRGLTAAELLTPSTIPTNIHYMTPNTASDGTGHGPPFVLAGITAKIVEWTASTMTIEFKNTFNTSIYLANNIDGVPHLNLLGYGVKINDGYVTQRDTGSISARRERSMDTEISWIQDRATAAARAGALASSLARPRTQVKLVVMGDPRRKPGQMIEVVDSEGTQAEGTWRIHAVEHNGEGAQYTQTLSLVSVGPIALWDDEDTGWDVGVWGE